MSDDHKIEKALRAVTFWLSNGDVVSADVFLRLYENHHSGPQNLGDLLNNSKNSFIPVKTSGRITLINKQHIVQAQVSQQEELNELMQLGAPQTITLTTTLGHHLTTTIYIELREGFPRLKDYVNQNTDFLRFFQDEQVLYIRRQSILFACD